MNFAAAAEEGADFIAAQEIGDDFDVAGRPTGLRRQLAHAVIQPPGNSGVAEAGEEFMEPLAALRPRAVASLFCVGLLKDQVFGLPGSGQHSLGGDGVRPRMLRLPLLLLLQLAAAIGLMRAVIEPIEQRVAADGVAGPGDLPDQPVGGRFRGLDPLPDHYRDEQRLLGPRECHVEEVQQVDAAPDVLRLVPLLQAGMGLGDIAIDIKQPLAVPVEIVVAPAAAVVDRDDHRGELKPLGLMHGQDVDAGRILGHGRTHGAPRP